MTKRTPETIINSVKKQFPLDDLKEKAFELIPEYVVVEELHDLGFTAEIDYYNYIAKDYQLEDKIYDEIVDWLMFNHPTYNETNLKEIVDYISKIFPRYYGYKITLI